MKKKIIIGIDATNVGGGGGITHLKEIISNYDQNYFNDKIEKIIVFGSNNTLKHLKESHFVEKISYPNLNKGLIQRIWFQLFQYDKEIFHRCDILFSITGDYIGKFRPVVSMSRNMLLYERQIWKSIRRISEILRFWTNFKKQERCFKNSIGIIFISEYAKKFISSVLNLNGKDRIIIKHGISQRFIKPILEPHLFRSYNPPNVFKFLYVSTVHVYKHQWNVIEAVANLRNNGYFVELHLVGGTIFEPAGERLKKAVDKYDPNGEFVFCHGDLPYEKIDMHYKKADGIVFASTCENMPNILIESMGSGVPIACSNKLPMPEFLEEGGYYFDAEDSMSISNALEQLLNESERSKTLALANLLRVQNYSWEKTSKETFNFIVNIFQKK